MEKEEEAIRMANDSHYGLAAYVYSHDIGKALRTAHAIESGWIQVNQGLGSFLALRTADLSRVESGENILWRACSIVIRSASALR